MLIVERVFEFLLPAGVTREGLLGDLLELRAERAARFGHRRAHIWYLKELMRAGVSYAPRSFRSFLARWRSPNRRTSSAVSREPDAIHRIGGMALGTRAEVLQRQHRKVLRLALCVAALVHVGALLLLPGFRIEQWGDSAAELQGVNPVGGVAVDVRFGPPTIKRPDGTTAQEPAKRQLQVVRFVRLPAGCKAVRQVTEGGITGGVRVRVDPAGYAKRVKIQESTGEPCADRVIVQLAGDLQYRWLPTDEFPAPVELVQPVTLVEAVDE